MRKEELDRIQDHWLGWAVGRHGEHQRVLLCTLADGTAEIYSGWTALKADLPLRMQVRIRRGEGWLRIEHRFTAVGLGRASPWRTAGEHGSPPVEVGQRQGPKRKLSGVRLVLWKDSLARSENWTAPGLSEAPRLERLEP